VCGQAVGQKYGSGWLSATKGDRVTLA
jgi:hypothetical protein